LSAGVDVTVVVVVLPGGGVGLPSGAVGWAKTTVTAESGKPRKTVAAAT
jgi:hypothetical protein